MNVGDLATEVGAHATFAEDAKTVREMTWWRYVVTVTGEATQKDIASATGIDQSSISRWQRGANTPRAEAVVAFARAYERPPVEALVAAGYLSSSEMGVVEPATLAGDLSGVSIESLVSEIRARPMSVWRQAADLCPGPFCVTAAIHPGLPDPKLPEESRADSGEPSPEMHARMRGVSSALDGMGRS